MRSNSNIQISGVRFYVLFSIILLFGIAVLGKVAVLQWSPDKKAIELAQSFTGRVRDILPTRGQIWSSDGNLLATTVTEYSIFWDSKTVSNNQEFENNLDSICIVLEEVSGVKGRKDFKRMFHSAKQRGARYQLIVKHLSYDQISQFRSLTYVKKGRNKAGFIVTETQKREKPYGTLASRTIGLFRATDKVGLELTYDSILSGLPGKQLQELIPGNIWKPMTDEFIQNPVPGCDIVSTIDVHLQDVAEHALKKQLDTLQASWGCAILMEVETGYVRAIANLKRSKDGGYSEVENFAAYRSVEPGSTMKLASLMACLEEGTVTIGDTVNTGNGVRIFNGKAMHDSHEGGYGALSLEQVFEKSSNVGTALATKKVFGKTPQQFLNRLQGFGLGSPLGIELVGEAKPGLYTSIEDPKWSGNSLTNMSIGYEVSFTPLQMLAFYNAVANNGNLIKPLFVQEFRYSNGRREKREVEIIRERICSESTLKQCKKMMEGVGEKGGTADAAFRTSPYKVAGKTGTCRLWENGSYQENRYRASFVGYFPAENPKYSCLVVIEDPQGMYYAALVAAPVFKELADKIYSTSLEIHGNNFTHLGNGKVPVVRPTQSKDLSLLSEAFHLPYRGQTLNSVWTVPVNNGEQFSVQSKSVEVGKVPSVQGMGLRDAIMALEHCGYKVKVKGKGHVVQQSILPGTLIKKGGTITIQLQ